jgi:RNA polymerase sigma-70 factor (ECF subfamily)
VEIDPSVAEAFRRGEQTALEQVYQAIGPLVRNYLWLLTRDPDLADDLTQDVFAMAIADRERLRRADRLVAWIMRTARSVGYSELRKNRRRPTLSLEDDRGGDATPLSESLESPGSGSASFERMLLGERGEALQRALSKLKPKERDIVAMIYFLDMKQREVADALETGVGNIGTMLRRALDKLRDHLEEEGLKGEDLL